MKKKILWELPVPSHLIETTVKLIHDGADATLLFDYKSKRTGAFVIAGIEFESVLAFRNASEKFVEYIPESLDTLLELEDSEWIRACQLRNFSEFNYWKLKHFVIYLDSYGLYEFMAQGYSILDEKEGTIEDYEELIKDED